MRYLRHRNGGLVSRAHALAVGKSGGLGNANLRPIAKGAVLMAHRQSGGRNFTNDVYRIHRPRNLAAFCVLILHVAGSTVKCVQQLVLGLVGPRGYVWSGLPGGQSCARCSVLAAKTTVVPLSCHCISLCNRIAGNCIDIFPVRRTARVESMCSDRFIPFARKTGELHANVVLRNIRLGK